MGGPELRPLIVAFTGGKRLKSVDIECPLLVARRAFPENDKTLSSILELDSRSASKPLTLPMFRRHVTLRRNSLGLKKRCLLACGFVLMGLAWLRKCGPFRETLPITPQSLLVVLVAVVVGLARQAQLQSCCTSLVAVSARGVPVFADGAHGWQHFAGSTGGFLLAFPSCLPWWWDGC